MSGAKRQDGAEPAAAEDLLAVARLLRPHGLRGEVHAEALTPSPIDFEALVLGRELRLRRDGGSTEPVRVAALRPHGTHYLATLEGRSDRAAAGALNGAELCLARDELPSLPEGWYWEADLEGLAVHDRRRGAIGRAAGLASQGEQWFLKVQAPGGETIRIPWVNALVPVVDLEAGRIETDLPDDYPDLPDAADSTSE